MGKRKSPPVNWAEYYERSDILKELVEEPVHFSLDKENILTAPCFSVMKSCRNNQHSQKALKGKE